MTTQRCGCRDHDGFVRHNQDAAVAAATVADDARAALLADLLERVAGRCTCPGRARLMRSTASWPAFVVPVPPPGSVKGAAARREVSR
jgi:hypothetical protein